ncbi:MAG: FG-GAP-like repeat-containing protein [Bacteroidetes bacterium]|nr:FG-GAP-like repeat-containing protein [Bacteroidota bacterium]
MRIICLVWTLLFSLFVNIAYSQSHDYVFVRNNSTIVKDSSGITMQFPWAGGFNSPQFSAIDLNADGIKDLFVFDKIGNRISCFINNGIANSVSYTFAPEYAFYFPPMISWVQLIDYNNDGKEDIFTYSNGGIKVFKNYSTTYLFFKQYKNPIMSSYNGNYTNLFCLSEDYPAIVDIDNDGDLDILNFSVLGKYVNYHKNLSMENYGNADSLVFKLSDESWGCFAESEASNVLKLDSCFHSTKTFEIDEKSIPKHSGSTLLAADLNGDGLKDLIIGDVDYANLIKLTNGGTYDTAHITAQDTNFPSNTNKVWLYSFPSAQYLDVNNDGKKDLIVSPYDANLTTSENYKSCWYYKNTGTNTNPVFQFQTEDFLQHDMIDVGTGAYPVLFDFDNDGLKDLFVSNIGYRDTSYLINGALHSDFVSKIALYKNTGTATSPAFKLITRDFAHISALKLIAAFITFGDINNDGKAEMIVGNSDGKLYLFVNNGTLSNPNFVLSQTSYQNIDAGDYSTPQLFDLDKDGLLDLIIGERQHFWKDASNNIIARKGNLNYYRNTGTLSNPIFSFITDSLGGIDVTNYTVSNYGFSTPCFFRTSSGETRLIVGNEDAKLFYYKNIDNNLNGKFTLSDTLIHVANYAVHQIAEGSRSAAAIADLDNDGYQDIIVGNAAGGLAYYKGSPLNILSANDNNFDKPKNFHIFPNPASTNITLIPVNLDVESSAELEITDMYGKLIFKDSYNNTDKINISVAAFRNGIYLCNIKTFKDRNIGLSSQTERFIVMH